MPVAVLAAALVLATPWGATAQGGGSPGLTQRAVDLLRDVGALENEVTQWEGRRERANAEVARLRTENDALRKSLGGAPQQQYTCAALHVRLRLRSAHLRSLRGQAVATAFLPATVAKSCATVPGDGCTFCKFRRWQQRRVAQKADGDASDRAHVDACVDSALENLP
jgi:hypothetical protein